MADAQEPSGQAPDQSPKKPAAQDSAANESAKESALSPEALELLRFVREQNQADRDYFDKLAKNLVWGISVLLTLAAGLVVFFGMSTIHDIKSDARSATADEITRMRGEIRSKLADQFSTPTMQRTISDAAVGAVKSAVTSEVSSELSSLRRDVDSTKSANIANSKELSSVRQQVGSESGGLASSADLLKLQGEVRMNRMDTQTLLKREPLTWSMALVFPDWDAPPNKSREMSNFAAFAPTDEIIVSRIMVSSSGISYVDTPNGPAPCSNAPLFSLFAGGKRKIGFALSNGPSPHVTDMSPISIDFGRGAQITASLVMAFDKTRICHDKVDTTNAGPYNITVDYSTTGQND